MRSRSTFPAWLSAEKFPSMTPHLIGGNAARANSSIKSCTTSTRIHAEGFGAWSMIPCDYLHSSAKYYATGERGLYAITNFMELRDVDLTIRKNEGD
ncbi:MAG TPA: hypothetical protein VL728_15410 [Cyclobacteriaceae bacterium]|nr:hypothetical protein [Cyclobacteriaceae bacterium]